MLREITRENLFLRREMTRKRISKYKHCNCHAKHLLWERDHNEIYHSLTIEDTRSISRPNSGEMALCVRFPEKASNPKNVMRCPCNAPKAKVSTPIPNLLPRRSRMQKREVTVRCPGALQHVPVPVPALPVWLGKCNSSCPTTQNLDLRNFPSQCDPTLKGCTG